MVVSVTQITAMETTVAEHKIIAHHMDASPRATFTAPTKATKAKAMATVEREATTVTASMVTADKTASLVPTMQATQHLPEATTVARLATVAMVAMHRVAAILAMAHMVTKATARPTTVGGERLNMNEIAKRSISYPLSPAVFVY